MAEHTAPVDMCNNRGEIESITRMVGLEASSASVHFCKLSSGEVVLLCDNEFNSINWGVKFNELNSPCSFARSGSYLK